MRSFVGITSNSKNFIKNQQTYYVHSYFSSQPTTNNSHSKEKTKSLSKEKIKWMIKANIHFPCTINNVKDQNSQRDIALSPEKNIRLIKERVYERVIIQLFKYMEKILDKEIYIDIKNKFDEELKKEMICSININNYTNFEINHAKEKPNSWRSVKDSNGKINTDWRKLKLSYEIDELNSHNSKCYINSVKAINNNKGIFIQNEKKHSLYTLTKSKMPNCKKQTRPNSQSNSIEKNFCLQKTKSKIISKEIKNDFIKPTSSEITHINNEKNINKINGYNQKHKSKKILHNTRNLLKGSPTATNSKGKNANTSKKKMILTNSKSKLNKPENNQSQIAKSFKVLPTRRKEKCSNNNIKDIQPHIIAQNINPSIEEAKNSEQLRKIKLSLDDNLKVMFNFSYDVFLNKESESESRRSYDEGNCKQNANSQRNPLNNNKLKSNIIYKTKYEY